MSDRQADRREPQPEFVLAVVVSHDVPDDYARRKVSALTARVRHSHRVTVLLTEGGPLRSDWEPGDPGRQFAPLLRGEYGRFAGARRDMELASKADALLVLGDPRRWARLLRLCGMAGVPYRTAPDAPHAGAGERPLPPRPGDEPPGDPAAVLRH